VVIRPVGEARILKDRQVDLDGFLIKIVSRSVAAEQDSPTTPGRKIIIVFPFDCNEKL
jgi:hypothetical protein